MNKVSISKRRWLLLPVETKARELTAKTLLACEAAERGWGVIIGGYKGIIRKKPERLPRGTYLEKSVSPTRKPDCLRLKDAGNRISAWCEEGLLYLNAENYRERRVDAGCFNTIDYFFAWGKQQAEDMIPAIRGAEDKIILSGNPRFDLLRPEMRRIFAPAAADIRSRYGKIIMLNTKFSMVNNNRNTKDFDYISYLYSVGKIKSKQQEAVWRRYIRLNEEVISHFFKLLPVLSREFSDHTIIIRPHPSENHDLWVEKAKGLPNVKVVFEGSANEWLLAADVMIHNNCTTGIEAFLLERPAISYRPFKDDAVEHALPDQVSLHAAEQGELVELVRRFCNNGGGISEEERREQVDNARHYIANIDGKPASETVMDTLEQLDLPLSEGVFPLDREKLTLKQRAKKVAKTIKHLKNKSNRYSLQKFPGATLDEMGSIVKEIRSVTGRFAGVGVVVVEDNTFCIYSR